MPTYHARSVTVRLGSMPLTETTTNDVVFRKGDIAKRQSEAAETKLLRSVLLDEDRVLFPGDPDGYELNWLGNAPFMQVKASEGVAQRTSEGSRLQALALHINLSDKAFASGFSGRTHLKIEVFINGQLSNCSLVHTNDIRSGAKSLHQVFAGYRVDFLIERPWVLLPPYMTPDGGGRRFCKTITPAERWEEISAAILGEVEKRGTDKDGKSPPSAVFLHALATMQMPASVTNMQKPGGRKFGVVDVVVTAGKGSKLTSGINYLKSPQRLKDSSFTVHTEVKRQGSVASSRCDQTLDLTVANAEGNGDTGCEPPRKRQALSPVRRLPQPSTNHSNARNPFSQIPYLPPPKQSIPHQYPPAASGSTSPRCPSTEYRSDGHKKPLPSEDRHRSYEVVYETPKTLEWSSNTPRIFHEYDSSPSTFPLGLSSTSAMKPTPISIQSSDPRAGYEVFSGMPFFGPASATNPTMQAFGDYRAPIARSRLFRGMGIPGSSTSYVSHATSSHFNTTDWSGPPNVAVSPYYCPSYLPQQARMGFYSPGLVPYVPLHGLPTLIPQTTPSLKSPDSTTYITPLTPSPRGFHPLGRLPPTALFSVTSKPRCGASPTEGKASNDLSALRPSILIRRLVITGKDGKLVVDHSWKAAQQVGINHTRIQKVFRDERDLPDRNYESPTTTSLAQNQSDSRGNSLQPCFTNMRLQPDMSERRDSMQDVQALQYINISLPYLKRHQGPQNADPCLNAQIDVPDKIAAFVPASMLVAAHSQKIEFKPVHTPTLTSPIQPKTLQRRTYSRNPLPSVQGPKAATFLFDDPEDVLREAARMRRSRSPTKPEVSSHLPMTPPAKAGLPTDPNDSSPLSSVPASPVLEAEFKAVETVDTTLDQLPQLDGSPEHAIPTPTHRSRGLSPTKSYFPTPKFQQPEPVPSHSEVSPDSQKRKASSRSPTRLPRSPDRLKTVDNPPLNDDCVIAFAESKNKDDERGVLRQVKGERQGVFKEEYVTLAVRFFIAGD